MSIVKSKKKDKKYIKIKKGGSITESIIDNLFFLAAFFIGIGVLLYFMKSGLFSLWGTAKEYGEIAKETAEIAIVKTTEVTKDAVAAGVVAVEPVGKVLGKTNDIVSTNPINKAVVSFGTDDNAIKELYNIEKNPETGEYAVQYDEEPSGVQGFVNATFKQLIGWFGFDEDDAIRKLEAADKTERATDSSTGSNRNFSSMESSFNNNSFKTTPDIDEVVEPSGAQGFDNSLNSNSFKSMTDITQPLGNETLGGDNSYGPKKITIYKILGLLLLLLYLEHYKK